MIFLDPNNKSFQTHPDKYQDIPQKKIQTANPIPSMLN